jgi:hypothetical protein
MISPTKRLCRLCGLLHLGALTLVVALGAGPAQAQAISTARYVDATGGDDASDGTSPATAWQSLGKVNAQTFGPGGSILFKDGETWTGPLLPKGSGAEGAVISIGRYGDGSARPLIQGEGAGFVVFLLNQEYWEITGLEITNFQADVSDDQEPINKRGIYVLARDYGVVHHIVIRDVVIHDINSGLNDASSSNTRYYGGIFFEIAGSQTPTYFDGIVVEECHLYDVDRTGISNDSSWWIRSGTSSFGEDVGTGRIDNWVPSVNVVVRDNLLERIGGNGVIMRVSKNTVVERNRVFYSGEQISGNGMFTFNTDSTLFQHNEVAYQVFEEGETDAAGIDSDFRTKYTIIQYNYLHHNGEGGLVATGGPGGTTTIPRFNIGTVMRYNILVDNQKYGVHTSGLLTDMLVHNNVFYTSEAASNINAVDNSAWGGAWSDGDTYINNIFYNGGSSPDYALGRSTNVTFDHNLYAGTFSVTEPDDPNKVKADPLFVGPLDSPEGFQLQAGSPAMGAGVRFAGFPEGGYFEGDYFGNPIPPGGPVDIGAHQLSMSTAGEEGPGAGSDRLVAYPNPAQGVVTLDFDLARAGTAQVTLYDVLGRQVGVQSHDLVAGPASVRLGLSADLPAGLYVVRVEREGTGVLTQRIVVMGGGR